jgi:glutamate carboxypeptidase
VRDAHGDATSDAGQARVSIDRAVDEALRVSRVVEADIDGLLGDLERWVTMETPSRDLPRLNLIAEDLAATAERYGASSELVAAGDDGLYVHAVLTGTGDGHVALLCHHDTVYPVGTAARWPFSADGTRVFGPGVADMKGGIAVGLHVMRALAEGGSGFGRVELVSVPDEEPRTFAFATLERLLGCDAVLCLECGRVDGSIVSSRKGGKWMRLAAHGRAAHAGVDPDGGLNAILPLCEEGVRLSRLHNARPGVTFQLTLVDGGVGFATVPPSASLTCDVRAASNRDLAWAIQEIMKSGERDDIGIAVEDLGGVPLMERTPAVGRLAETAISLGRELGEEFGEASTGGVSDGSWTASAGIPTLDGLGPVGGQDHTFDEYAEVASFAPRCGVVAGLIVAISDGLLRQSDHG